MSKLNLTIACWDYDRVRPLMDGRVRVEGCEVNVIPLAPEEVFFRAFRNAEFEVSELSLSSYMMAHARGTGRYTAIPVFLSRLFRHSSIYIRTDRGIAKPADLRGRRIGVPEYQMTAALVARGVLQDEYGVNPAEIRWLRGGLEQPGREEKQQIDLPAGVVVETERERSLSDLLEAGLIDGLITARAPDCFGRAAHVGRLFADAAAAERAWYRKTGIYPIMHAVGVRKDVLAAHPWVAASLQKAFTAAKDMALAELDSREVALKISLPFLSEHVAATRATLGPDFWPYGHGPNRVTLAAMTRWSFEQGLTSRQLDPAELFAPGTLEAAKI